MTDDQSNELGLQLNKNKNKRIQSFTPQGEPTCKNIRNAILIAYGKKRKKGTTQKVRKKKEREN